MPGVLAKPTSTPRARPAFCFAFEASGSMYIDMAYPNALSNGLAVTNGVKMLLFFPSLMVLLVSLAFSNTCCGVPKKPKARVPIIECNNGSCSAPADNTSIEVSEQLLVCKLNSFFSGPATSSCIFFNIASGCNPLLPFTAKGKDT